MKSAVFLVSALLAVSCQALTPIGPDGPDGPGPLIDPLFPGFKIPRPIDPIRPPVCGLVCAIACPNGNVLDSRGCPTCQCKPSNCLKARSCFFCPYGRIYFTDNDGCGTCKCKPKPDPVCPVYVRNPCEGIKCPGGFQKDSNGCPTCKCKPFPIDICPPFECFRKCSYGYNTDSRGCKLCSCKSGGSCTYNGRTYSNGQTFKKDCNDCFCLNGRTLCTEKYCNNDVGSCRDGNQVYPNGQSYKKDCNTCFCRNGRSLCTMRACLIDFDKTRLEA